MHDLGYADLRVVNEYPVPFEAAKSAVDASSVLTAAQTPTNLADAVADCTLVFGTTAVGERALEHPLHLLEDASALIRRTLAQDPAARIAILFGSEKTGLTNEELSHCHALLTIPMNTRTAPRHLSMNLGQAAAVCLYTIAQHAEPTTTAPSETPANAGDVERITTLFRELLDQSGYTRRHPANAREATVRRLIRRLALTPDDATVWTGILRQLLHATKQSS